MVWGVCLALQVEGASQKLMGNMLRINKDRVYPHAM